MSRGQLMESRSSRSMILVEEHKSNSFELMVHSRSMSQLGMAPVQHNRC